MERRKFLKAASLITAATTLAACQAETPQPGRPSATPPAVAQPTSPAATSVGPSPAASSATATASLAPSEPPPAVVDLPTLITRRLTFGARPSAPLVDPSAADVLTAFLDSQLNPDSIDDSEFEQRLQAAGLETLSKSLADLAHDHIVHNPYGDNDDRHWEWYIQPYSELIRATFLRAVYSRKQLPELLADFWHNHFNVFGEQDEVAPLLLSYDRDVIRANQFGNFRQFLEGVASHPSMLVYLNNRSNTDAGPNENFARELLELHTLGAENYLGVLDPNTVARDENGVPVGYVDNDVYETARCFTGWRLNDDLWEGEDDVDDSLTFLYYQPWHDRFNKLVLGQYLPSDQPPLKDGRDVLDLLASHPGTARHIARKLCRRFVADDPPPSLVDKVAATFLEQQASPTQLRAVYRTLFLSDEFQASSGQKLKRPLEWAVSTLRALEAEMSHVPDGVFWTTQMMGQALFGHHAPDGYADTADAWTNSMSSIYGWNLITGLAENWWSEEADGHNVTVDLLAQTQPAVKTPDGLLTYWLQRFQLPPLPSPAHAAMLALLAGEAGPTGPLTADELAEKVPALVTLLLMSPPFRSRG